MPVLVSRAASHFAADLESGRPELKVLSVKHWDGSHSIELEVDLATSVRSALELEGERQGITLEELLEYATVYYLADIESGLAAERILRRAEEES